MQDWGGTHERVAAMKGIVFVELLKMAENLLGEAVVDQVLDDTPLSTGGAFSAVGDYPCADLVALVGAFSRVTGLPGEELQRRFGHWMMNTFKTYYPAFFEDKPDVLAMLEAIEGEVHVEVRKIYPGAELPTFATERLGPGELRMDYSSTRPLVPFCAGLIEGCVDHFGRPATITTRDLSTPGQARAEFTIRHDTP